MNLKSKKGLSHLNAFYTSVLFKQTFKLFIVSPFVFPLSCQFDEAYIEELFNRKKLCDVNFEIFYFTSHNSSRTRIFLFSGLDTKNESRTSYMPMTYETVHSQH